MSDVVEKTLKTRIRHRHATQARWNSLRNFIPRAGELIFYDNDEDNESPRMKLGDGVLTIDQLPFLYEPITDADIDEIIV